MDVEPLDHIKLEDLGLNTCNHDVPLSSREVLSLIEPEPQPQPLPNCPSLDVSLGDERGPEPPITPHSAYAKAVEVLIFYQAYGNLYTMTGRKAHLLEDKQIPSVEVVETASGFPVTPSKCSRDDVKIYYDDVKVADSESQKEFYGGRLKNFGNPVKEVLLMNPPDHSCALYSSDKPPNGFVSMVLLEALVDESFDPVFGLWHRGVGKRNRDGGEYETLSRALAKWVQLVEARFEDTNNQAADNNGGDKKDPNVYDKQEVKKADDQENENVKDEERKNVIDQQVSEQTINETAYTITSLQSEVASLDAKGSLDANEEIKKDHIRFHELEKQVKKLPMELQLKNNFREALKTTSKDSEKKMIDLNPTLHDPQKVIIDEKKKHYKTKYALKIDNEEFKKVKFEATTKIIKLAKVCGAWLPPWLAARLVVFQLYVKNHSKEFLFIQGRIWDPRIKRIFKTSP
ncbi:hypothetical protein Tco_0907348 [Tanacetum coccineum]|uniref:Uncharacterized protein n=1 Tax=Tanacetum coccineum TaxID=301880 RepID=A0ABQ5CMC1_9ASTR